MEISTMTAALPGAIGVTHLKVYDTLTPDGLAGGSPHVHFACTEAYLVVAGRGAVQTLSAAGFDETPLTSGGLVWFTPGVIHRLINRMVSYSIYGFFERTHGIWKRFALRHMCSQ